MKKAIIAGLLATTMTTAANACTVEKWYSSQKYLRAWQIVLKTKDCQHKDLMFARVLDKNEGPICNLMWVPNDHDYVYETCFANTNGSPHYLTLR